MKRYLIPLLLVLATPVAAQQATPPADPVATQMGALVIEVLRLQQSTQGLQTQLTTAQAEVKRLKDKYEPQTSAAESPKKE